MVKIIISDTRMIPTLGKGPFKKPVEVSEQVYNALKMGGYKIRKYEKKPYIKLNYSTKIDSEKLDDKIVADNGNIITDDDNDNEMNIEKEENEEETILEDSDSSNEDEETLDEETESEDVEEEDKDFNNDEETLDEETESDDEEEEDSDSSNEDEEIDQTKSEYTKEQLEAMSVKEIKDILNSLGITFKYNDTKSNLIAYLIAE